MKCQIAFRHFGVRRLNTLIMDLNKLTCSRKSAFSLKCEKPLIKGKASWWERLFDIMDEEAKIVG